MRNILICLLLAEMISIACHAQENISESSSPVPGGPILRDIQRNTAAIDKAFVERTEKYLAQLSRIESRLKERWQRTHAQVPFPSGDYNQWIKKLKDTGIHMAPRTYISRLDSIQTALRFLQAQQLSSGIVRNGSLLSGATTEVEQFQAHLDMSSDIHQYIAQRQQQITRLLSSYTQLPADMAKDFSQLKTTAYYYHQEVEQYKDLINRPRKLQEKALQLLDKVPAFRQFMAQNSMLAQLFRLPADYDNPGSLSGLQTRAQVQQILQQQAGSGGAGGMAILQQQVESAQEKLGALRDKVAKYGPGGEDVDMPGFTPDHQRTKTFLQRLTYGFNIQLAKSTTYFPATGNLGFSIGYKISDKSSAGIGLSYNLGLGSGWNHIHFSSQGLGLRSYMDWRIKSSYYVIGGLEENYLSSFQRIAQLQDKSAWQASVLVGLEKKYRISQKLQGNIQLLYDALYRKEIPPGQMIKFRVGYNF
jgi:hypothetical protein